MIQLQKYIKYGWIVFEKNMFSWLKNLVITIYYIYKEKIYKYFSKKYYTIFSVRKWKYKDYEDLSLKYIIDSN